MGNDMLGILVFLIALTMTIISYVFRRPALGISTSAAWLVACAFMYGLSAATWDIYYGLFWFSILMAIIVVLETFVMRPKKKEQEPEEIAMDGDEDWNEHHKARDKSQERLDTRRRGSRRTRKSRNSNFAQTGKIDE